MDVISEKIVNIGQLENQILAARCNADNVERFIREEDYDRAYVIAKILSLQMHELTCFNFQIEHRKIHQAWEGKMMQKSLEQRVEELEKRVAELEGQVPEQPKKFIPEDSTGICYGPVSRKPD